MAVVGIQSAIWSNRLKTSILVLLFPIFLFGLFFIVFFALTYFGDNSGQNAREFYSKAISGTLTTIEGEPIVVTPTTVFPTCSSTDPDVCVLQMYALETFETVAAIFIILGPIILIWGLISFIFYRKIIFSFTEARPLTRVEYPELYNIVENLCISRGLPVPNLGILEDDSFNAFAVGWNPKKAWIVFSRGIINKLNRQEIEAVAAHELTHIMNKDGLLMVTIIVFIGAVAAIGEILFRLASNMRSSSDSKDAGQLQLIMLLIGIILLILGYLVFPFVQLAVSRKREYLADAGSVELTHDKLAMMSALEKISSDSVIESIKKDSVSALCISNPFPKTSWFKTAFHEFFSTHPSIENRVEMLKKY